MIYQYSKHESECIKDSFTIFNCDKRFVLKTMIENFSDLIKKSISDANYEFIDNYDFVFPKIDIDGRITPGSIFCNTKIIAFMFSYEISYNSDNPHNRKYRDYSISVFNHKRYITDKNGYVIYMENYEKGTKEYGKLYDMIDDIIDKEK